MTISDPIHTPDQAVARLVLNCAEHPAAREAVPVSQFTGAMSTLASSVSVVTAAGDGERHGRTVTAMLSLSAEPPALLVSITRESDLAALIEKVGKFSVSILADGQDAVADAFAGWGPADRFEGDGWDAWPSGQPRLEGAVASFDCALAGTIVLDTHILYAGIVLRTASYPDRLPLLWHQRRYAGVDIK